MPKVNVYLPDDLAAKVKEFDIPMSRVCQEALEREVSRAALKARATTDMDAVVARLRQTKQQADESRVAEGREAGIDWARTEATVGELEEIADTAGNDWLSWNIGGEEAGENATLAACIESYGYRPNSRDVIRVTSDDPFIQGFLDGALELWNAVPSDS